MRIGICQQCDAVAIFEHLTITQHENLVGALHSCQSMGDDDRGAPRQQVINCLLDQMLRHRVETRRSFVEDHQTGVFEKDTGKGE